MGKTGHAQAPTTLFGDRRMRPADRLHHHRARRDHFLKGQRPGFRQCGEKYGLDFRAAYDRIEAAAKNDRRPNYNKARLDELTAKISPGVKLPLIVYFHGCAGMLWATMGHLQWLAKFDDFVVIAPDSFARPRPHYCFGDFTVTLSLTEFVNQIRRA